MAKIIDPDDLTQNVEVSYITGSKLIALNSGSGNMDEGGVALQTLYSFTKEEWRTDDNLVKFQFPIGPITSEQFEFINGWDLSGSVSPTQSNLNDGHYLIRDAGWAVRNALGLSLEEWMNITTLGTFEGSDDTANYQQSASLDKRDIILPTEVNQAVHIFLSGSGAGIDFDYRTYFLMFLRERGTGSTGKTYAQYDLPTEQNISALTYRKYQVPLETIADLKVTATDVQIDADSNGIADIAPYASMSIEFLISESATRSISSQDRFFQIVIDGNSGTAEQIYEFVQWSLRQSNNVNSGAANHYITGATVQDMLVFVGDTLRTLSSKDGENVVSGGVYIDNFLTADTNRLEFTDNSGVIRTHPFVAAGNLLFNDNLFNDISSSFFVFFTNDDAGDDSGQDFGTENAILINDNAGPNPITGLVGGLSQSAFDYDYDFNVQRGAASSGSDVPFTGVALGLGTAQYVVTTGTWTRSVTNTVNFVAALERTYLNPV